MTQAYSIDYSVFRPHRSTTYVDVDYCCSSVVCQSVISTVTVVSPAKIAEPVEMPLGLWTRVSPRNHVLDGGPDPPPMGRGNFEEERGSPLYISLPTGVASLKEAMPLSPDF